MSLLMLNEVRQTETRRYEEGRGEMERDGERQGETREEMRGVEESRGESRNCRRPANGLSLFV